MNRPILYIHGFASSGHSAKAKILRQHFDPVYTPSLSHIPALAVETLASFIQALPTPPLLIGSSLGGYYALYLSQRFHLPAVLINPVTRFELPLHEVVGLNRHYYDGSRFEFTAQHLESLRHYETRHRNQNQVLLLLQLGDALIDQQKTLAWLPEAHTVIEQGGSHEYQDFASKMALIRDFASGVPA